MEKKLLECGREKKKLLEIWSTNGLEGTEKPLR
jgi:hypothetical protein